jgi:hypothetical protein
VCRWMPHTERAFSVSTEPQSILPKREFFNSYKEYVDTSASH